MPSDAMIPELLPGDFIFVNKLSYFSSLPLLDKPITKIRLPKRDHVVVFRSTLDSSQRYIKRVIGLPGDKITMFEDGIAINGKKADYVEAGLYDYLDPLTGELIKGRIFEHRFGEKQIRSFEGHKLTTGRQQSALNKEYEVPSDSLFVLGDNSSSSIDSRHFGFVPVTNLIGKAIIVALSWDGQRRCVRWPRLGRGID